MQNSQNFVHQNIKYSIELFVLHVTISCNSDWNRKLFCAEREFSVDYREFNFLPEITIQQNLDRQQLLNLKINFWITIYQNIFGTNFIENTYMRKYTCVCEWTRQI